MTKETTPGACCGVLGLLLLAALGGCDCRSKPVDDSVEPRPISAPQQVQLPDKFDQLMQEHAQLSTRARNALVRGDLPVATQAMKRLAFFMQHVPFPDLGEGQAAATRQLAREAGEASDLEAACMAYAKLTHACGGCHHTMDRGPGMKLDPVPAGKDITQHMRRHAWAVERMWEALLMDSTPAFRQAAQVLSEAPLHGDDDEPDFENPPGVTALAAKVHDLAAGAAEGSPGPSTTEQSRVFGGILGSCAQCHQLLAVELPPPQ